MRARRLILLAGYGLGSLSLALVFSGCKVRAPGALERKVATEVKQRLTVGGGKAKNPFAATPENIHQGQQQFQNYCTSCHGPDGLNSGVLFAEKMSPPVPHLDSPEVQEFKDGQLQWIIANGVSPSGMPAWKDTLEEQDMWKIVLFIRSLKAQNAAITQKTEGK